jgi:predicted nuclease with TOPRIM domain
MTETDILNELLTANPNEYATKGMLLLMRAEMKSEFKAVHTKLDQLDGRLSNLESRFDNLESRFDQLQGRLDKLEISVEFIAQNVALLVQGQASRR